MIIMRIKENHALINASIVDVIILIYGDDPSSPHIIII